MSEELQIVEYEGVRVATTRQIAEAYGATPKKVSNNFNANKARYTEGKHYFLLQGEELKAFWNLSLISGQEKRPPKLYLWTQRGALLLAKSINTDIARKAYERLVDFYFEVKEEFNPPIEKFPEEQPRITYQTSSTPVPKNPSWQARNRRRIKRTLRKGEYINIKPLSSCIVAIGRRIRFKRCKPHLRRRIRSCTEVRYGYCKLFPRIGTNGRCLP